MPLVRQSVRTRSMHTAVRALRALLWFALAPALAACVIVTSPDDIRRDARDLSEHRARWRATRITSYDYTIRRNCFCAAEITEPVRVSVRNGAITSLIYESSGYPVPQRLTGLFPTIDGLFGIVEDAIDRNVAMLSVQYDGTYAFPRYLAIDYVANAIDDEITIDVSGFVAR